MQEVMTRLSVKMGCCREYFVADIVPLNEEGATEIFPITVILPGPIVVELRFNPQTGECEASELGEKKDMARMLMRTGAGIHYMEGYKIKGAGGK